MRVTHSWNNLINGTLMWSLIALCLFFHPPSLLPAVIAWLLSGATFVNLKNGDRWDPRLYLIDVGGWAMESLWALLFLEGTNVEA